MQEIGHGSKRPPARRRKYGKARSRDRAFLIHADQCASNDCDGMTPAFMVRSSVSMLCGMAPDTLFRAIASLLLKVQAAAAPATKATIAMMMDLRIRAS